MPSPAPQQQPPPHLARPGRRSPARPPAPNLSNTSLRWAMGLYCSFVGAFMLVAPHQFAIASYAAVRSYGVVWALAALAAGMALLAAAGLRTRKSTRLTAHGLASLVLAALALGLAWTGAWTGAIAYTVLAAGLMLPAGLRGRQPRGSSGDLLSLLMGIIAILVGSGLALAPRTFLNPFPAHRSYLPLLGLALLGTGLALCWAQLRPPGSVGLAKGRADWPQGRVGLAQGRADRQLSPRVLWAVHLAAGVALMAFGALAAAAPAAWTGIALYWGVGSAVALLPGLREWLAGIDTSALRTRLALALAGATSLALVFTVAISTAQEEQLATAQAVETLSVEAHSVAQNVRDYVELNGARAATLAALAGRLPLSPEPQRQLLENSRLSYGDVAGLLLLGVDGGLIATDGGATLDNPTMRDIAAAAAAARPAPVQLGVDRITARQLLLVAAPVYARGGSPAAVVVMALDSRSLERRIAREGSIVSLADGYGDLLARSPSAIASGGPSSGASRLPPGWDRQALREPLPVGSPETPARLAAFAPVPDFTWVVAVERPRASALAGVNRGRDLAFGVLLLVLPLAVAGGILVARLITRPLGALADAVAELAAGNRWAPLESSRITEIERLSAAFREMRDRLAERTAESERLAAELRARAEALAEGDRRKNEFLAMLAHELRNPLGAISTATYLMAEKPIAEPAASRAIAIIQRQTQHLARLVDDLLDVSRITRGKVELRRMPLDLGEVVKQVVETTSPLVEARNHRLELSLPGEPLPLLADPTRLEQVLANLIRNAVKFTAPGGTIEVAAASGEGHAEVRIRDNGIGIPGDLLPRVFDLFIQGQQGLDRSAGGLGIGLTLVRSLVEMHGGEVRAASEGPGQGSEFTVRLPLAPTGAERAAATVPMGSGIDAAR